MWRRRADHLAIELAAQARSCDGEEPSCRTRLVGTDDADRCGQVCNADREFAGRPRPQSRPLGHRHTADRPPRWQIEAFQSFIMPEALVEQRGYSLLTPEVKDRMFGRNAARIFGIDISAAQGRSALQTSR